MTNKFTPGFSFDTQIPGIELGGKYFPAMQDMSNDKPSDMSGVGPIQQKAMELINEGYSVDDALKLAQSDTVSGDDKLWDYIRDANSIENYREKLELKNAFERERMADALPYNLIQQIPRTIMQGAVLPATVALGGAQRATDALARLGNVPIGGFGTNPAGSYNFS